MGAVIHLGFMTFLLVFVVVLLVMAFAAPEAFREVVDALGQIARALTGR